MKRTFVTLVDDLDGGNADETVFFGVDGRTYEVDLSKFHATTLREVLAPFVAAGRRAGRRPNGISVRPAVASSRADNATIRAWAVTNGYQTGSRGRISAEILEAYEGS